LKWLPPLATLPERRLRTLLFVTTIVQFVVMFGTLAMVLRTRHPWSVWWFGLIFVPSMTISVLFFRATRNGRRVIKERGFRICPKCSYDLRDLSDDGHCPECGQPYTQRSLQTVWSNAYHGE